MKRLDDILGSVDVLEKHQYQNLNIEGLTMDSRKVRPRFAFVAYKGGVHDGHDYIDQAIAEGAACIILENLPIHLKPDIVYVRLKDCRSSVGFIASEYFGNPTNHLKLVGVTGTNGKTTTVNLLYDLFERLGFNTGLVSTIHNKYGSKLIPAQLTTPDPVSLQELFRDMLDDGVTHVFMEVSSHALDQGRVNGVNFDVAVFTNITHDHLDYHGTFKAYIKAKKLLFDMLAPESTALVNIDDLNGKMMVQNTIASVVEYALKRPADMKAKVISNTIEGLHIEIDHKESYLKLIGKFNAYNALAAYSVARILNVDAIDALVALSALKPAEGRLDIVEEEAVNYKAIIDYAHTPDALEKVLETISEVKSSKARILTVIGCGGNRDKTKRPKMAQVSCRWSDISVFTSDNPRDEDPQDIISDMLDGLNGDEKKKCLSITDRKEAIKTAALMAKDNDIILIAGKGHEKYQIIKGQRYPFDDKKIIRAIMRREGI